jgi:prepilin-type N-terminal cleavage/methylation domain-containing protein
MRRSLHQSLPSQPHPTGFTLLELIIVMVILGIVVGLSVAGIDRFDPGNLGLRVSVETFLESSRDRARVSGHPVTVVQIPASGEKEARLMRFVFQRALEASFEKEFQQREGLELSGSAALDAVGRFGACGDLQNGGTIAVAGRGMPDLTRGFSLDVDLFNPLGEAGELLNWEGFLAIVVRRSGVVAATLRAGKGELQQDFLLESPADSSTINKWQHLKLIAADEMFLMVLDGREVARMEIAEVLGTPRSAPVFGDTEEGWRGFVDEFTVWARIGELGPEIPGTVALEPLELRLLFDRNGMLDATFHPGPVPIVLSDLGDEIGSFVVGRFTQEVSL